MRLSLILLAFVSSVTAFTVTTNNNNVRSSTTSLDMMNRRDAMGAAISAALVVGTTMPQAASAFSQQLDDYAYEPQQQATDGRFDLNSAFVGEYKQLRGMFPTAAGKIASNGPYTTVQDIYKIPGLTDHDMTMFKKYERMFTVNPPGRSFYERINARVST